MEKYYTVNELTSIFKISKATFYHQVKKNQDFFTQNSRKEKPEGRNGKPLTKYSQSVFDFFAHQYGNVDEALSAKALLEVENQGSEAPATYADRAQEPPQGQSIGEEIENPYQEKIKALESQIEALETQLKEMKGERDEAQKQLSIALLCLQQEKAEKQLLLPAPKKPFIEKVKSLFHSK